MTEPLPQLPDPLPPPITLAKAILNAITDASIDEPSKTVIYYRSNIVDALLGAIVVMLNAKTERGAPVDEDAFEKQIASRFHEIFANVRRVDPDRVLECDRPGYATRTVA